MSKDPDRWSPDDDAEPIKGPGGVIRQSPTADNYHRPDPVQLSRVGSGWGRKAVTIPQADASGASRGFDPNVAGPVHVDPDHGGVILDPTALDASTVAQVVRSVDDPSDAYAALGQASQAGAPRNGRTRPSRVSTQPANAQAHAPTQPQGHTPMLPVPQFQPPQPQPQPQPLAAVPSGVDPVALFNMLAGQIQSLQNAVATLSVQPPTPPPATPLPPLPPARTRKQIVLGTQPIEDAVDEEPVQAQQTVSQYENSLKAGQEAVITGFETLHIPSITGPLANKPAKGVVFDVPGLGKQMFRYHDAIVTDTIVVLVYDSRFEDGIQFQPMVLEDKDITVEFVRRDKGQAKKAPEKYVVRSMGMTFSHGVLDYTVLPRNEPQSDDEPDDEETQG